MKVIGYNSSHETTLAQYDTETNKFDFIYEEERFRRTKYWTPKYPQDQLLCIERKKIATPDAFIGASFDRRQMPIPFDEQALRYNREAQQSIQDFCLEGQMTTGRVEQLFENHKAYIVDQDYEFIKKDFEEKIYLDTRVDDELHGRVADQLNMDEFHYEIEHHLYHAECGYYFSEWNQKEDAIAIVMDGGGCHKHAETYPMFQEVETIFLCEPNETPKRQYSRMSNLRWMEDVGKNLNWMQQGEILTAPEVTETIDGCETVFSSHASMGMNFSMLSMFLGFDKSGRAAGKVMGAASYQDWNVTPEGYVNFTLHSVCNQLQQYSFEFTCNLIQKAIDKNPDVPNIILSGGFALNCTNNAKYLKRFPNHQIFIDPIAHDGGTAVGAAVRLGRALVKGEDV